MTNTFFHCWLPTSMVLHVLLLIAMSRVSLSTFMTTQVQTPLIMVRIDDAPVPPRAEPPHTTQSSGATRHAGSRSHRVTRVSGRVPNTHQRASEAPIGPPRQAAVLMPGAGRTPAGGSLRPGIAYGAPTLGIPGRGAGGDRLPGTGAGGPGRGGEWVDHPDRDGAGGGDIEKAMPGSGGAGRGGGAIMTGGYGSVSMLKPGGGGSAGRGGGTPGAGIPGGAHGGEGGGASLGRDIGGLRISTAGIGTRGGAGWGDDTPDGVGGPGGGGMNLQPARPSYGAAALGGPTPGYPALAEKENVQGTVTVAVTVRSDGSVAKVGILKRSCSDALDNEAVRTAKKWSYRPAVENGEAVESIVKLQMRFELGKTPVVTRL